jgi:hypothetical protein
MGIEISFSRSGTRMIGVTTRAELLQAEQVSAFHPMR